LEELVNNSRFPSAQHLLWIEDDAMLRDEGVLFGLSGGSCEEKSAVIRAYFETIQAPLRQAQRHYRQLIETRQAESASLLGQQSQQELALREWSDQSLRALVFPLRTFLMSIVLFAGSLFCFPLFYLLLKPYTGEAFHVSLGVFLVGLFVNPRFLQDPEQTPSTDPSPSRKLLALAMPLSSALFAAYYAYLGHGLALALFSGLFFFLFFYFTGPLMLAQVIQWKKDWYSLGQEKEAMTQRSQQIEGLKASIQAIIQAQQDNRLQVQGLINSLLPLESELAHLQARCESKIKLFESEFHLSRSYKSELSEKQVQQLKSYKTG
jgi:hypothetical protein